MTEATKPDERLSYGNWFVQRSPGLFGAGLSGTLVLFATLVFGLLSLLSPLAWRGTVVVAMVGAVAFTLTGTPVGGAMSKRFSYLRAKAGGATRFRSGVLVQGPAKTNRTRLPGVLGETELLFGTDTLGQPFAVIKSSGRYTIVARCTAEGLAMQDQDRIDAWVAGYSVWLTTLGQEDALVCAKAIVDTAPDPGGHTRDMIHGLRRPGSPYLASAVMDECAADLPAASSDNVTYLEMTFRGSKISRQNKPELVIAELARKVPGIISIAQSAGGGSVEMVTPDEMCALVRVAYDPAAASALEQSALNPWLHLPETDWHECGPVATEELAREFIHDSGRSVTWEMHQAPKSKITETALAGLVAPHSDFARKRVALIYRPHTPDKAVTVAERDHATANFLLTATSKKRPSASASLVAAAADQSRQEVARGAGSVRFSLMVTATVLGGIGLGGGDLPQAVTTLEARSRAVPLRLRRCYGSQAAAFAATLPVGFIPWEHTTITQGMREWA